MAVDAVNNDVLVGKWFHTFDKKGELQFQGKVLARISPDYYLVQLHEWANGDPSHHRVFSIQDMLGWRFYPSNKSMRDAYESLFGMK